jgi:hypothetical protein
MKTNITDCFPALQKMFEDDYKAFSIRCGYNLNAPHNKYAISFKIAGKYTKIIVDNGTQRSVLGFICMQDVSTKLASFKAGELLKAAGWKAPAMNFARGSIFDLPSCSASIKWTGIQ